MCGYFTMQFTILILFFIDASEYDIKKILLVSGLSAKSIEGRQNIWELGNELEGDILSDENVHRRNLLADEKYRWPNYTVPLEFDAVYDIEQRQWVMESLKDITKISCVKFRLRVNDDEDYVFITHQRPGCNSYTGRIGGRQILNLKPSKPGRGCFQKYVIVHEFLHVLGFLHQQSVHNRDDYVLIHYENIKLGKERNFKKYEPSNDTNLDEVYDYRSIMHYSSFAKSVNGEKTIEAK
ncbi:hypothetical protein ILUMI_05945, partial [Ignelater luminosus]